jgi:hypothetical protein
MTMDDAKTLRINELVTWSASDDKGYRHDVKGRVLKVTAHRIVIALAGNAVVTVSPQRLRRYKEPWWKAP